MVFVFCHKDRKPLSTLFKDSITRHDMNSHPWNIIEFILILLYFFSEAVAIERNAMPLALYRSFWRPAGQQSEQSSEVFRRFILKPMYLLHLHIWI